MLPTFVGMLVPDTPDRSTVASRKSEIRAALTSSGIDVVSMLESGSFSHGTGIKAKSDVDVMVWTSHTQKPLLPSSVLTRYRNALSSLITRSLHVSTPVVQVEFWAGPEFEVAPAFWKKNVSGIEVYDIGGRRDEWVSSAPAAHNDYVSKQNDRLSKKVKPLVRLMKAWKYNVSAPVSSFYLEMRTAEYARGETGIYYYIDLRAVFRRLITFELRDMNDPAAIAGRIPATSSEGNRLVALSKAKAALALLEEAEEARTEGRSADYWLAMTKVFGNDYPWPS